MTKELLAEKKESLWWLVISPVIWSVHFLLSYITAAVWCAKFAASDGGGFDLVRGAIGVYTVVALGIVGAVGRRGYRRYRFGAPDRTQHADSPEDRHRFMGFATLILSGLSGVAIVYSALVVVFIKSCF